MLDDQLSVLSNRHRRRLLVTLAQWTPQPDHLAPSRALAADGGDEEQTDQTDQTDQTIAMQHVHLSKLADHGFIDWDQDAQRVTKGPQFDEIEPLLTVLIEN